MHSHTSTRTIADTLQDGTEENGPHRFATERQLWSCATRRGSFDAFMRATDRSWRSEALYEVDGFGHSSFHLWGFGDSYYAEEGGLGRTIHNSLPKSFQNCSSFARAIENGNDKKTLNKIVGRLRFGTIVSDLINMSVYLIRCDLPGGCNRSLFKSIIHRGFFGFRNNLV